MQEDVRKLCSCKDHRWRCTMLMQQNSVAAAVILVVVAIAVVAGMQ